MKLFDKFLKVLKTDRNTFCAYLLTMITAYIVVDRIVEMLFIFFTGTSAVYWGPYIYTVALACPVFAFLFAFSSKLVKGSDYKLPYFYTYCIALYIIGISMLVQWINEIGWILFFSVPEYKTIILEFYNLIKPAFCSIGLYIVLATAPNLFNWLYKNVNDTKALKDSIKDFGGLDISDKKIGTGPYTCEIVFCKDKETGKNVKIPEVRRFESTLIVGVSGSGKTSMVFEPMIARDIERKYFFREAAKEMGFAALRSGIASLNMPYDNDYLNENFSLNMLQANEEKKKVYLAYMDKMLYNPDLDKPVYKDLGLTYVAPEPESVKRLKDVAKNFKIKLNIIDPNEPDSVGLNPFIYENPTNTAIAISSVLRGMYSTSHTDVEEAFRENIALQAIENLTILLKVMYPILNDGDLPTLEDMLIMLNDFDLVEEMCNKLERNEELKQQYNLQLGYFKKHFYRMSGNREETEKFVYSAITQLDTLLRYPGIKSILCNRTNNINFNRALKNGEITFLCTRRGDLGQAAHKAFGLFFLLLMQYSVLTRPGNEKTRIPHFLYVDEFPEYVCKASEPIFTMYRKYRVGSIISGQNLSQFGLPGHSKFRDIILANCSNKMVFGNNIPEENQWWADEFGKHREWKFNNDYHTNPKEGEAGYDEKYGGINWGWKNYFEAGKVQTLKFKECGYKTKNIKGKLLIGTGAVDFIGGKYKKEQEIKTFSFSKYNRQGVSSDKQEKSGYNNDDDGPVKTDISDSRYFLNNEDAISFDLRKKNK